MHNERHKAQASGSAQKRHKVWQASLPKLNLIDTIAGAHTSIPSARILQMLPEPHAHEQ